MLMNIINVFTYPYISRINIRVCYTFISQTIQVEQDMLDTWRNKNKLIIYFSLMDSYTWLVLVDQQGLIYINSEWTLDAV